MLENIKIDKKEVEKAVKNADSYLKHFGQKKKINWFDMSHLLAHIFPQYDKEELLKMHIDQFDKKKDGQND